MNNTLVDNSGGMKRRCLPAPRRAWQISVVNNIVAWTPAASACAATRSPRATVTLRDNLIYTPSGVTSEGDCTWEATLLTVDPQFVGGEGYRHAYWLQPGSPAIDAGDNGAVRGHDRTDLTGAPRISGPNVDLGAFEFRQGE